MLQEVQEYFVDYILNDRLGIIDNAHIVFADSEPRRAMSPECIELAQLHSIAVDSPKSGVVAEIPDYLRVIKYPDFMEKSDKRTYKSERVIGKLFREVKDLASHTSPVTPFTSEVAKQCYDPDMEVDGFKDYISDAFYYRREYDRKMVSLMEYYGIETEAEILSGHILTMPKSFEKRRDMEQINYSVMALRKEARAGSTRELNQILTLILLIQKPKQKHRLCTTLHITTAIGVAAMWERMELISSVFHGVSLTSSSRSRRIK